MGLKEIAGHYKALRQGFQELGVPCSFVNLTPHPYQYGGEDRNLLVYCVQVTSGKKGKFWKSLRQWARKALFAWALLRHDVFIFSYNTSLLPEHRDLPILKRFGKKIIFQYHGSDGRPPYLDGSLMAPDQGFSVADCIRMTRQKKEVIRRVERYADVIINNPTHGHLHERPFVIWLSIGLPNRPPGWEKVEPSTGEPNAPIRILHCPSHPVAKGTPEIRQAVKALQEKGLQIELVEITGQPNHVVQEALAQYDIVIDQLYADYGMPGFATEAAWHGKPVLIGGYPVELWNQWLPADKVPPTLYCHPDDFQTQLERLVVDRDFRESLGKRAQEFVMSQWQPRQIAQRYLDLATKPIPTGWLFDSAENIYWQGCCFSEASARALIKAVYTEGGPEAFQMDDKPELLEMLITVATRPLPSEAGVSS